MGFYEKSREDNTRIHISRSNPHSYPAHFHQNLEIFILKSGKYSLTINAKTYNLDSGDIAVCDCYDIHEYKEIEQGDDCVIIIPSRLLDKFNYSRSNMRIANNVIHSEETVLRLLEIADKYICNENNAAITDSAAQLLLEILKEKLSFSDTQERGETDLIRKILTYTQNNFKSDITRNTIADALGYTEAHISRVFHKYMGIGIRRHINNLRLDYVNALRKAGDKRSEIELIYEAGFGSEQTYYRHKKGAVTFDEIETCIKD